jgi:SAM-dependent methyltransferase
MYGELAPWFHLLTHPKSYAGEARYVARLLKPPARVRPTMLELGSGGGNNAFHLKKHFDMTLSDIAPRMLTLSRSINPECEHVIGDMRNMRLRRTFDFVFAHDATMYMTSERDLARAIRTAFVHCKPGGTALFQPDCVRETYATVRRHGGHSDGARKLHYVEQWHPLTRYSPVARVDFKLTLRNASGFERVIIDHHRFGVFPRATWLRLLRQTGFRARIVVDAWKRECFLAVR